jgi:hypothetical protein
MARPYQATFGEREMQQELGDGAFAGQGLAVCETAGEYRPRRPEESVLCSVVASQRETFLARQRERGRLVPRFVERELRSFLD